MMILFYFFAKLLSCCFPNCWIPNSIGFICWNNDDIPSTPHINQKRLIIDQKKNSLYVKHEVQSFHFQALPNIESVNFWNAPISRQNKKKSVFDRMNPCLYMCTYAEKPKYFENAKQTLRVLLFEKCFQKKTALRLQQLATRCVRLLSLCPLLRVSRQFHSTHKTKTKSLQSLHR